MAAGNPSKKKYVLTKSLDNFFEGIYSAAKFILQFFKEVFVPPYEFRETIRQCYLVGNRSLFLISITAFIMGMVFTDHSRPALAGFGATSWLPSLTGIAIVKALAPLISALICAGRAGSQIAAELGSMKVTEQMDAMEVSAIDPFRVLAVTRMVATTVTMPLLVMYACFVGIMGSYIDIASKDQTSFDVFIHNSFLKVGYAELSSSLIRSVLFGFTIGAVGCYQGFATSKGTEGVGKAANSAVVIAMLLIFIEEIFIVKLFNPLYLKS